MLQFQREACFVLARASEGVAQAHIVHMSHNHCRNLSSDCAPSDLPKPTRTSRHGEGKAGFARECVVFRHRFGSDERHRPMAIKFESPSLHQEVRSNRRDFPGSEITRHFRDLCAENRSLRSVWHVQATFLGASHLKSLAANFRFQSCFAPNVGAARSQAATRGEHRREELAMRMITSP